MSRRTRRRKPCPLCSDMGVHAPAVTHRVVHRWPETAPCIFHGLPSGPTVIRVQVCQYHADGLSWSSPRPHVSVYRLKGARR